MVFFFDRQVFQYIPINHCCPNDVYHQLDRLFLVVKKSFQDAEKDIINYIEKQNEKSRTLNTFITILLPTKIDKKMGQTFHFRLINRKGDAK